METEVEVQTNPQMLSVLASAEIDRQIATALTYPRNLKKALDEATSLATMTEEIAGECMFALPRKEKNKETGKWETKNIEGPSARFAEILAYSWGNLRGGARVVDDAGDFVTSQGVFHDLQKNVAVTFEVRRRITNSEGRRYSSDMIAVTGNAAASIAYRNAVLKGIPKAFWKPVYDAAVKVIRGDAATLVARRDRTLQKFQKVGATPEMVCKLLGVASVVDITSDHLVTLYGVFTSIKDGDTTVERAFADPDEQQAEPTRSALSEKVRGQMHDATTGTPTGQVMEPSRGGSADTSVSAPEIRDESGSEAPAALELEQPAEDSTTNLLQLIMDAQSDDDLDYVRGLNAERKATASSKAQVSKAITNKAAALKEQPAA
jgi:hypothetical protein